MSNRSLGQLQAPLPLCVRVRQSDLCLSILTNCCSFISCNTQRVARHIRFAFFHDIVSYRKIAQRYASILQFTVLYSLLEVVRSCNQEFRIRRSIMSNRSLGQLQTARLLCNSVIEHRCCLSNGCFAILISIIALQCCTSRPSLCFIIVVYTVFYYFDLCIIFTLINVISSPIYTYFTIVISDFWNTIYMVLRKLLLWLILIIISQFIESNRTPFVRFCLNLVPWITAFLFKFEHKAVRYIFRRSINLLNSL